MKPIRSRPEEDFYMSTWFFIVDQVALPDAEPLIHFALNCGAKGCPPIKTYTPQVGHWPHPFMPCPRPGSCGPRTCLFSNEILDPPWTIPLGHRQSAAHGGRSLPGERWRLCGGFWERRGATQPDLQVVQGWLWRHGREGTFQNDYGLTCECCVWLLIWPV